MTTTNVYFTQGTRNEQYLIEDLIIESLRIYGQEMFYIPRQLVSKDNILGEDRLSEFKQSFPIEMYFENVDSFDGQGAFIQKFGMMMEQSATLVVARRRWEQMVGRFDATILPHRPCEGDLIYFPLTKGLFEVKFVKHQDPFYQLGKLHVYKLQVELFQYSSERIDTGNKSVDVFESLKTFSTDTTRTKNGSVMEVLMSYTGQGYTEATARVISATGFGAILTPVIEDGRITSITIEDGGTNYRDGDEIEITGNGTDPAIALAIVKIDIDKVESYGDNNSFQQEAASVVFNEENPFGDPTPPPTPLPISYTADVVSISADNSITTSDVQ